MVVEKVSHSGKKNLKKKVMDGINKKRKTLSGKKNKEKNKKEVMTS